MAEKKKVAKTHLSCPFCDTEIAEASFPYCEACKVTVLTCPSCKKPVARTAKKCPSCGATIGAEIKGSK